MVKIFDEAKAQHVIDFIEQLKLTKGKWAGQNFKLLPWEVELIKKVFGTVREDGTRQYRTVYVEIGKKNGKQLALDTPIPTPTGWITMGEIKTGEKVLDEKGSPCNVVAISEIDDTEQAYEITFEDGSTIIAGERHEWWVQIIHRGISEELITTGEMYQGQDKFIYRIPITDSIERENISNFHYIKSIDKVGKTKMKCIQVDSPSRLYLAGKSMVPTHNSEVAAAIALYMLLADGESNAEVYVAACDRQQASIIFNTSVNFVNGNKVLSKVTKTINSTKRIVYPRTGSFYQVLSSDVKSKSGLNVSCVILDEIWTYPNAELAKMLTTGSGDAREEPLFVYLTTAGNKLQGYGWEMHCKAKDILSGKRVDDTFLPIIYGLEEGDDWEDEANWYKTNPSLGHTIQIDRVREHFIQAKQDPVEEALFKQLRLNMWLKQQIKWMPMEHWGECSFEVDPGALIGRVCYAGLDLSSSIDITAFVLVFPPLDEDDKYMVLPYFWIPEENMHLRVRRDRVPYDIWEQQGFIKTTEGNVVHYGFIETFIEELGTKYNIREIAFDRWGAVQMSQNLDGMGFTVVPFGQGYKDMSPPTKELMKLTLEKKIAHGGNPVLHWMMDNIFIKTDPAGNIKPDKEKSTEKIDGAVATIMALDRAIRNGGTNGGGSVYDTRGILLL